MRVKKTTIAMEIRVCVELDESEIMALDGIFSYGAEAFLKVFENRLGEAYIKPYEAGVRSLHDTVRNELSGPIARLQEARRQMVDGRKLEGKE